ncbi:hypothetical protein BH23VER1_BH23VER1_24930 [soil metagenome]
MSEKPNPFVDDVFLGGADAPALQSVESVESINSGALRRLFEDVPEVGGERAFGGGGRVALLLAPRAGFGKSHLIARVASEIGGRAQVVPLVFNPESPLEWSNVLTQLIRSWEVPVPGGEDAIAALDDLARFTFATLNRRLIEAGKIPCARPAIASRELRKNYRKLFDFSDAEQASARWFGEHFEKLLPVTSSELAGMAGVRTGRAVYWLRALCAYAQGVADSPAAREEALRWALANPVEGSGQVAMGGMTIAQAPPANASEGEAKGKIRDLLRLAALHRPVVFVIDHLDAYFRNPDAGRTIAYMVTELQQMVPRELAILSLNEDVWETAFQGVLPSAFEDRLTSNVVNLKGVTAEAAEDLVRARLAAAEISGDETDAFLGFLRLHQYFQVESGKLVSPRVLLRYAAIHWDVFSQESAEGRRAISLASGAKSLDTPPEPVPAPSQADAFPLDPSVSEDPSPSPGFLDAGSQVGQQVKEETEDEPSVLGGQTLDAIAAAAGDLLDEGAARPRTVEGGESPDADGAPDHPTADGGEENPFRRLKTMLTRLREERAAHGIPEEDSDDGFPGGREPERRAAPDRKPVAESDGTVLGDFRAAQARWEQNIDLAQLDFDKFRNLIEIAGKRFPVVRYDEIVLNDFRENPVARWAFRGNEIYIGFASSDATPYWSALRERIDTQRLRSEGIRAKVVVFETVEKRFVVPDRGGLGELLWDVVEMTRPSLAAVYAADELLLRAQAGEIDADPGQILGVVASELDPLWKRLTRPVENRAERDAA